MKLVIVAVGKLKDPETRRLADDYLGRLRRYTPCEEREVKTDAELPSAVPKEALLVALEVHGDAVTSPELARRLESWVSRNKGVVAFMIGGRGGHSQGAFGQGRRALESVEVDAAASSSARHPGGAALPRHDHPPRRALRARVKPRGASLQGVRRMRSARRDCLPNRQ